MLFGFGPLTKVLRGGLPAWQAAAPPRDRYTLGILAGEGIGPEVIDAALDVLEVAASQHGVGFDVRAGGKTGKEAVAHSGVALTREVREFCASVFEQGGAVLAGPAGGRFVYEIRKHFDLFCKLSPVQPVPGLGGAGVLKEDARSDVDIVVVREIAGGTYLGEWGERHVSTGVERDGGPPEARSRDEPRAYHTLTYSAGEATRVLRVARNLALARRGRLTLVLKPCGLPAISALWTAALAEVAEGSSLTTEVLEIDNAAYQMIQRARDYDVIVAPNLFGDILADLGGLLLGGRGLCFSGNFGADGRSVYNTGHGAAYDLAGQDLANPLGTICCLAMALHATYGLHAVADSILAAVDRILCEGLRSRDIETPGCRVVGTREFARQIARAIEPIEARAPAHVAL